MTDDPHDLRTLPVGSGRRAVAAIGVAILAAAAIAAPSGEGAGPVRAGGGEAYARCVTDEADLIPGPVAAGRLGDWVIGNGLCRAIVSAADHPVGFARSGGNIIDAAPEGGRDLLQLVFPYLDATFPRHFVYGAVRCESEGGDGHPAAIVAEGVDSHDPAIRALTTYRIAPGDPHLTIATRVTREAETGDLQGYDLGDALQWGATRHFAPGSGVDLPRTTETAWIAGIGDGTSYGYVGEGERTRAIHGRSWSDPIVKSPTLRAGGSVTYTRHLILGRGGTASIARAADAILGRPGRKVAGRVVEAEGDDPVAGARVEVFGDPPGPLLFDITDTEGRFDLFLPEGEFTARAVAQGREPTGREKLADGLILRLGAPGSIRFRILEGDESTHGRITIEGLGGTLDPDLGPPYRAAGAGNLVAAMTGEGEVAVPPGRYRVTASRGPECSIDSREVRVEGGKRTAVDLRIRRVVDTSGYIACDFHQHAANSADSGVSLEDRVISNLAEGLELMVSSDHDHLTDFAPVIERLGVGDRIRSMVGDEVTTGSLGHFNAFPLLPDPSRPRLGAIDHWGRTPPEIFAGLRAASPREKVIQVNHPRASSMGYFSAHDLDAAEGKAKAEGFSWEFDAIEVMNGPRSGDVETVLRDWVLLLNRGRTYVATGNSDTHDLFRERAGYPRSYLRVGEDDVRKVTPQRIVEVLKVERSVIVTNGPFLTLEGPGGAAVGSTVRFADRDVPLRVRLEAPEWIRVDRVEVVCNGKPRHVIDLSGTEWDTFPVTISLDGDGWFIAIARGDRPMDPVLPERPFAFTNPIWIDREGDGFDPPVSPR